MKLLIVEDEKAIATPVIQTLLKQGFAVDWYNDGKEGLKSAQINTYDCILLDLNLPSMDGVDIAKQLRKDENQTPIIMLTARHMIEDRIRGFAVGADDYIPKPFAIAELIARIRAVTKRFSPNKSTKLKFADSELYPSQNLLKNNKKTITLSNKETAMLEYFIRNPNKIIPAEEFLEHVWDSNADPFSDTVRTHIKTLRQKCDPKMHYLKTVRGKGYIYQV